MTKFKPGDKVRTVRDTKNIFGHDTFPEGTTGVISDPWNTGKTYKSRGFISMSIDGGAKDKMLPIADLELVSEFKAGDVVYLNADRAVFRSISGTELNSSINAKRGDRGVVKEVSGFDRRSNTVHVVWDNARNNAGSSLGIVNAELLTREAPKATKPKFKTGDRVRVVRDVESAIGKHWSAGTVGTVNKDAYAKSWKNHVQVDIGNYKGSAIPEDALELVSHDFKIGDRVRYTGKYGGGNVAVHQPSNGDFGTVARIHGDDGNISVNWDAEPQPTGYYIDPKFVEHAIEPKKVEPKTRKVEFLVVKNRNGVTIFQGGKDDYYYTINDYNTLNVILRGYGTSQSYADGAWYTAKYEEQEVEV